MGRVLQKEKSAQPSTEGPGEQHPPAGIPGGRAGQKAMIADKIREKDLTKFLSLKLSLQQT